MFCTKTRFETEAHGNLEMVNSVTEISITSGCASYWAELPASKDKRTMYFFPINLNTVRLRRQEDSVLNQPV